MTAMQTGSPRPYRSGRLTAMIVAPGIGALALTLLSASAMAMQLGVSPALAMGLASVPPLVVLAAYRASSDRPFGLANSVTSARAGLAAALLTPIVHDLRAEPSWIVLLTALLLLALDGVDGWVARRRGEATPFGARLDMEADALLLAVLALLVWLSGRAGAWILLAPALRPAFILAGRILPRLRAPLPPSLRRKLCCVVPMLALSLAIAPPLGERPAAMVALAGLLLLVWSFAVDVRWLAARRRRGGSP